MISLLILITALFFAGLFFGLTWAPLVLTVVVVLWVALLVAELRDLKPAPALSRAPSPHRERASSTRPVHGMRSTRPLARHLS